ncbi:hypothetical protein J6590_009419, partial [Homalodisca vitripennis]
VAAQRNGSLQLYFVDDSCNRTSSATLSTYVSLQLHRTASSPQLDLSLYQEVTAQRFFVWLLLKPIAEDSWSYPSLPSNNKLVFSKLIGRSDRDGYCIVKKVLGGGRERIYRTSHENTSLCVLN